MIYCPRKAFTFPVKADGEDRDLAREIRPRQIPVKRFAGDVDKANSRWKRGDIEGLLERVVVCGEAVELWWELARLEQSAEHSG